MSDKELTPKQITSHGADIYSDFKASIDQEKALKKKAEGHKLNAHSFHQAHKYGDTIWENPLVKRNEELEKFGKVSIDLAKQEFKTEDALLEGKKHYLQNQDAYHSAAVSEATLDGKTVVVDHPDEAAQQIPVEHIDQ